MINGLGVVGWGVGGIEAEAGMLGQPVYFLTPEVVGVHLTGTLREGVTATDLALHITQMLRRQKVVGKFVEFYGEGAASLPVADRATIGNMAPEYGATMGFFPVDEESRQLPARDRPHGRAMRSVRELITGAEECRHAAERRDRLQRRSRTRSARLSQPSVAGPKRPQDRINLPELERDVSCAVRKSRSRRRLRQDRRRSWQDVSRCTSTATQPTMATGSQRSEPTDTQSDRHTAEDTSRTTSCEMVTNRPTPTPRR